MSKSNFTPNSFQVPNDLVDKYLLYLTDLELKVFLIIIRKTKGWQKEKDYISYSQFKRILNIKDDRTIKKAISGLIKLDLIFKFERRGKISEFSINLNPNPLHLDDPSHHNVGGTSTCNNSLHADAGRLPTYTCTPTKDTITKDINTTTSSSCKNLKDLEDWLEEKCKNAKNKQAYKATLLKKYKKEEKSVIEEFAGWQKQKQRQKETEKLISFQGKKIMFDKGEIYEIIGVVNKEDKLHVYLDNLYKNNYQVAFSNIEEIEKRIQDAK